MNWIQWMRATTCDYWSNRGFNRRFARFTTADFYICCEMHRWIQSVLICPMGLFKCIFCVSTDFELVFNGADTGQCTCNKHRALNAKRSLPTSTRRSHALKFRLQCKTLRKSTHGCDIAIISPSSFRMVGHSSFRDHLLPHTLVAVHSQGTEQKKNNREMNVKVYLCQCNTFYVQNSFNPVLTVL